MRFWDSSALVALLVNEADTPRRGAQLSQDPTVAVWWAALVECQSAIMRRSREGVLDSEEANLARLRLAELVGAWHEVVATPSLRSLAIRLLRTHPLRCADALQLAAALTLAGAWSERLEFVCGDTRLNAAADIEGLTVLG